MSDELQALGQQDMFDGICTGKSVPACRVMDGGMVCLCCLVRGHAAGPCRCGNCKERFTRAQLEEAPP